MKGTYIWTERTFYNAYKIGRYAGMKCLWLNPTQPYQNYKNTPRSANFFFIAFRVLILYLLYGDRLVPNTLL